ncbi:centromere protein O isoform X2 [Trichosurus vulpecula]|uniref:centromere protein O isoform X2 n=1 Tax=Trichosurus vulpecula TaxID=9337 RepID=UPI00186AC498|nr:centromere protein O isoform X2 [Trichosurus vulpecula]XP_036605398.1 centromere protein O isoform X2 [Trichosurus vulpecula]
MAASQKHGVLYQLERLEADHQRSARQQGRQQEEETNLEEKILKLRKLRDELKTKVKLQEASARIPITNLEPYESLKNSEENLEMKLEKAKAFFQAFHLTGLSGKLTTKGVCLCFNTAFEGNILDSYYVDLIIKKPITIHRHSVPVFIPLEQIAAKYLETNFQHFVYSLSEHLNAYSGRKYQADQLQCGFSAFLAKPLQRNSLCTLLSFTYTMDPSGESFPFCARLVYEDLTTALPTKVTIAYQGTGETPASWEDQRAVHETLFYKNALHKVFESFLKVRENFDCIHSVPGNR